MDTFRFDVTFYFPLFARLSRKQSVWMAIDWSVSIGSIDFRDVDGPTIDGLKDPATS